MTEPEIDLIKTDLQTTIDRLVRIKTKFDEVEFSDSETPGESVAVDLDDGDVEDLQQELMLAHDECGALSMHLDRSL